MKNFLQSIFILFLNVCPVLIWSASAQNKNHQAKALKDTLALDSVTIKESRGKHLPDVSGNFIFAGKKTNLLTPSPGRANLANNNARMAFATVPGLNIWEMNGSGLQINVGARGTDTHRSEEFNMRQNGYATNSDMFGYPENHYTPPFEAVSEIQVVRGSSSLQFGPQYGGMINYKIKEPDTSKVFGIESDQAIGSNKYVNSFNALGGKSGKFTYYGFFASRSSDGWREYSGYKSQNFYGNIKYDFNAKGSIALQFSRISYVEQDAGGLTDAQFAANSRQYTRTRNYFAPEINIPAILFNYKLGSRTTLSVIAHGIIGQRNSVQFLNAQNKADTINKTLNTYNPRQVDRDYYYGFTTEARLMHHYQIGNLQSTLATGIRYFTELTNRRQKATGTIGSDYDLTVVKPYGIDVHLRSQNYAAFAENIFQVTPAFSITPGVRFEVINSSLNGVINNATFPVSYKNTRNFPLFGAGLQYQATRGTQFYGNISQAYKPFLYASLIPADQVAVVNPDLKDSKGYNADLGYRGSIGSIFNFDADVYYAYYGDRVGNLTLQNAAGQSYLYTTNIGNGVAKGVEAYTELSLWKIFDQNANNDIRVFSSMAYNHGRYISGSISNAGTNVSLVGKWLEGSPQWIERAGLTYLNRHISSTLQFSYVGTNYSDANNTVFNTTGFTGIVPAYHVFDWAFNYSFLKRYHIFANVNNLLDARYFTRRILVLPGPGILPADGRTFNAGFGIKI